REANIDDFDGYRRFLAWFALEYIPSRNLPPSLLPDDLVLLLNQAVEPPLPLTAGMAAWAELRGMPGAPDSKASPEEIVASSFELLTHFLQAGDPRLIPDFVSQFWSRKTSP